MTETNYEHFFGKKLVNDTIMLLTTDRHPRPECRKFKEKLKNMSGFELEKWLNKERDSEFNW